jgi:membrane-bound serine protease (ClpP class)
MEPMPVAALLAHPAGAYGALVVTLAALVHAWHTRSVAGAGVAASAALLTALASIHAPPPLGGAALLALGVGFLQAEFLLPTYGAALLAGLVSSGAGSWLLLSAAHDAGNALPPVPRVLLAALGTSLLLAATLRGIRVRTLPSR